MAVRLPVHGPLLSTLSAPIPPAGYGCPSRPFQTTSATKNYWVGALGTAIREETLVCKFRPAVQQCATFILNEKGTGEAQAGCHDDWCTGLGMGIHQIHAATPLPWPAAAPPPPVWDAGLGRCEMTGRGGGMVGAVR